jgi:hypothetical protein
VAKEDDYADTVAPRLDYAGVDQGLCGVVDGVDYLFEKE